MRLANELDFVVERFKQIKNLEEYANALIAEGNYNDFETRLAWDCLRKTVPSSIICEWYDKYNCTDDHITTLAKKALRVVRTANLKKSEWYEIVSKHIVENYNLDAEAVEDATEDIVGRCFCYGVPTLAELPEYIAEYMNR